MRLGGGWPEAVLRRVTARLAAVRAAPGPVKAMFAMTFLSSVGAGLYVTGSNVYFVRSVGLSAVQVGFGLSAAALLGLIAGIPAGHLADRFGARNVMAVLVAAVIPVLIGLAQVRSFWPFLAASAVLGMLVMGAEVGRGALMAELAGAVDVARLAVYTRSAFNAGFSPGLLGAGLAIAVGTRPAYLSLFAGDAVAMALTCYLLLRLTAARPEPAPDAKGRESAWRDVPYLLVAQVSGLTRLGDVILTVGIPLWIVTRTSAPPALAAWLLVANTVLVVILQARVTRRAVTPQGAGQVQRWGFVALALSCVVIGPTSRLGEWLAAGVLLAGTVLLTFGEMWGEGAWWSLRYSLASQDAQGTYGAAFALGQAVPSVAGPVLVTALAVDQGTVGWLVLGTIFLACAVINRWPVRWAATRRAALQGG
jgi:hypothetical protein